MSDTVIDSSVAAKWILPETGSSQALRLISDIAMAGERLIMLDLAFAEITNSIWKRLHRGLATLAEARQFLDQLLRGSENHGEAGSGAMKQNPRLARRDVHGVADLFVRQAFNAAEPEYLRLLVGKFGHPFALALHEFRRTCSFIGRAPTGRRVEAAFFGSKQPTRARASPKVVDDLSRRQTDQERFHG